ncbi:MAG TPA: DUF4276 family protein, partial [Phycisphaerae bacterium]|nr:DUF4276 family protein [Phycisphaerae bacterium]HXK87993.1 DUF4276 family protein [Phycisphaerae bacterium]
FLSMNQAERPVYVSMMFDYFRLPRDWPGRQDASAKPHSEKASHVEAQIAADIAASMGEGFRPDRFIPYIQMHELEALVLAESQSLRAEFIGQDNAIDALTNSIAGIPPEEINDNPATAPSRRIIEHLPEYERRKAQAAVNVLYLTGLEVLRNRCPHFAEWLARLEALGGQAAGY